MLDQNDEHHQTVVLSRLIVATTVLQVDFRDYHLFIGELRQPVLRGMVTVKEDGSLEIRAYDSAGRFLGLSTAAAGTDELKAVGSILHRCLVR